MAKQTTWMSRFFRFRCVLVLSLMVVVFALTNSIGQPAYAVGNCPNDEIEGTGTNAGKCMNPDGSVAADVPTGQTGGAAGSTTPQSSANSNTSTDQSTNCAVEKIGWILCPIITSAAKISDKTFDILANNFLQTDPQLVSSDSGTKVAWEDARNLANIMFIIAFLAIIISQVTGYGINNYGIKKMIPKLIVAAIAVNLSYYICQIAVDLTNIFGYEIENMLTNIANGVGPSVFGSAAQHGTSQTGSAVSGTILGVIAGSALAVAGVVWVTLPMVGSVILFVMITTATIVIILLLRKALIVLLIVLSPIAFVMYLLPNTEKLFNRWMKMFGQLLMVFPVVGLLFGAGQLASTIILVSSAQNGDQVTAAQSCDPNDPNAVRMFSQGKDPDGKTNPNINPGDTCGGGSIDVSGTKDNLKDTTCADNKCTATASWQMGLVATGIAVAPLLAVWAVLKGALNAAGAVGGKINTIGGRLSQGSRKRIGEEAAFKRQQNATNYMQGGVQGRLANGMLLGGTKRGIRRNAVRDYAKSEHGKELSRYVAEGAVDPETGELTSFGQKLAGGKGASLDNQSRVAANAINTMRQGQAEEMKAEGQLAADKSDADLRATIQGEFDVNDPTVAAALEELGRRQDFASLEQAINRVANGGSSLASRTIAQTISQNAPELLTGGQVGALSRGDFNSSFGGSQTSYADAVTKNLENNILSAEKMASAGPSVLGEASRMATSVQAKLALVNSANAAVNDPILSKKLSRNVTVVNNFRQGKNAQGGQW